MNTMIVLLLFSAIATTSQGQGCDLYCDDYHRFCPAVKDPTFIQKYLSVIETLAPFPKDIKPPPVDCQKGFYTFACRKSCGICTPCGGAPDVVVEKKKEVVPVVAEPVKPKTCNPCTEVQMGLTDDGGATCTPKFEVRPGAEGECSCWCGAGTKTTEQDCITFEETASGECKEVKSKNNPICEGMDKSATVPCKERTCDITEVFEQTSSKKYADTDKPMFYKAYTADNQVCDMGLVGGPKREKGKSYTYQTKIDCNICLKSAQETFDHVDIRIDGGDAWKSSYVTLTLNGNKEKYYPMVYPKGVYLKNGNTFSFVKTEGVQAPK